MLHCTFDNDDGARPEITAGMKKYCENFSDLRKSGKGILLYGTVGTGKSFFAACIVNELVSKGYYWNNLYRKRGDTARYRLDIPDAWALEIIPYAELSMLKSISKEG